MAQLGQLTEWGQPDMSEAESMTSKSGGTVKSPAGQTISILSNAEWAELAGVTEDSVRKPMVTKLNLIRALWHRGTITDASGRATAKLHARATGYGYQGTQVAVTGLIADPMNALAIERSTNGKRTYSIKLVALPERWLERIGQLDAQDADAQEAQRAEERVGLSVVPEPESAPVEPSEPEPAPEEPQEASSDVPELEPIPGLDEQVTYLEVAPSIAMALLTQVVEIISAGSPETADRRVRQLQSDMGEMSDKLARRLAENDSLRRRLGEAGDQIIALKHERDGLFMKLRAAQHNLEQATNIDTERYVKARVEQEIAKLMQAKPGTTKGAD
jgi:hypothetical protein